ncbi:MAG: hypothetical protein MJ210_05035, partial [Alphaproteobacteria bacterium]|nr:hypothetical protein [Alphaproteobacteria bacterium]
MLNLLTWIVIAFVICVIFGIIKVDDVKNFVAKWSPKAKEVLAQAKVIAEKKAEELKKAAAKS